MNRAGGDVLRHLKPVKAGKKFASKANKSPAGVNSERSTRLFCFLSAAINISRKLFFSPLLNFTLLSCLRRAECMERAALTVWFMLRVGGQTSPHSLIVVIEWRREVVQRAPALLSKELVSDLCNRPFSRGTINIKKTTSRSTTSNYAAKKAQLTTSAHLYLI
jgi:hypothetical protein